MDAEDAARWEPQVGVGKVDRLANYISILQLFDKEENYYPMSSFYDAFNDGNEVTTAVR